jgi:hypothetical protein
LSFRISFPVALSSGPTRYPLMIIASSAASSVHEKARDGPAAVVRREKAALLRA